MYTTAIYVQTGYMITNRLSNVPRVFSSFSECLSRPLPEKNNFSGEDSAKKNSKQRKRHFLGGIYKDEDATVILLFFQEGGLERFTCL